MLVPVVGEGIVRGYAAAYLGLVLFELWPLAIVVENWRIRVETEQREEKQSKDSGPG